MKFTTPLDRQIVQRSNTNAALVSISGTYTSSNPVKIRVRFVPIKAGQGVALDWTDMTFASGIFSGKVTVRGGWYRLEAEAMNSANVAQETGTVERFGVGEVFVIAGHSVASGGASYISGASDDRVTTIPMEVEFDKSRRAQTGSVEDMPPIKFVQFGTGIAPAPFGYNSYFWSRFGELLVQRINVPVLILQTAFGGSNLEHWAKTSQGEQISLFSVPRAFLLPYNNLKHTIQKYMPVTGLRAILIDHGQNDYRELNEDVLLGRYTTFVNQARADLGHASLAAVINRQTPFLVVDAAYQGAEGAQRHIRRVQDRMVATPHCFAGPDYDTGLVAADRFDNIHLSDSGQAKAAKLWADALTNTYFTNSVPYLPQAPGPVDSARVVTDLPLSDAPQPALPIPEPTTPAVVTSDELKPVTSTGGLISSSLLPNGTKLTDFALIGLIILALGFTAFLLQQYVIKQN